MRLSCGYYAAGRRVAAGLLGPTRTYSNPVKRLVEMTAEVFYLRFHQIMTQDGPISALIHLDSFDPALAHSAFARIIDFSGWLQPLVGLQEST